MEQGGCGEKGVAYLAVMYLGEERAGRGADDARFAGRARCV